VPDSPAARGLTVPVPPTTIVYDRGALTVSYPGGLEDVLELRPPPRPRGTKIRLSWDTAAGIVLEDADPVGTTFSFDNGAAARRLAQALARHGPVVANVRTTAPPDTVARGTADRATNQRATSPDTIDPAVFADPRPAGFLLAAAQRWSPRAPLPLRLPFTAEQIALFVASGDEARRLAATVSRTWKQYVAAGGVAVDQYALLAEALLVQAERQNPSAAPGFLDLKRQPFGWGLYRQSVRWYDDKGLPVIGSAGLYWDTTYAPISPPPFAINLWVNDPQLYTLLTHLRQAIAGEILEVGAAAQGYLENSDLVLPAVVHDWDFLEQVEESVVDMLGVLVYFLVPELVGRFLVAFGSAQLKAVGAAILLAVKVAGYALEIDFRGHPALLAIQAGRELLLVRRREDGTIDALSQRHLAAAVLHIRELIVAMVTLLALRESVKGGKQLLRAIPAGVVNLKAALQVNLELGPRWAGAYGEGPSYVQMAIDGGPAGGRKQSGGTGKGATPERVPKTAPGQRPETWRELEKAVAKEFHKGAPRNSATYFTTKSRELATVLLELRGFTEKLPTPGRPDPLAKFDAKLLSKTRRELLAGTKLLDEAEAMGRVLKSRVEAATQVNNRTPATDKNLKAQATGRANAATKEYERWAEWMEVEIGKQELDLIEFDLANRQVGVVDASFAWRDPWHNLKSRVYLHSVNTVLGWDGGSALDVGHGLFSSRIMFGTELASPSSSP
jgi:hypothetical protein